MASPIRRSQDRHPVAGVLAAAVACASLVLMPSPASAAGHSARLSADLSDHLVAGSQTIRVIVHGTRAEIDALAARYNLRIRKYLQSGAVFLVNAGQLAAMRQDDSQDHLSGDIEIHSSVDATAAESIGADQVWAGSDDVRSYTGRDISVAVIDSGINSKHNSLRGRVLATRDFTGGDGLDHYGHGTHVAAIIAGRSGKTADTRDYRGIAPGAYLLNLRVLGDDGSGQLSDVIEAIDWTIEHRREYNVRVINLSLGAPVLQPFRDDPLCEAVERAVRAGIVVVAAAGNYGKTADGKSVFGAITSPANSPYAIAVGAVDTHDTAQRSDDTLATYSSKGPTRYDLVMKPDLAAPGSHIRSAESADSYLSKTYPQRHVSGSGANAVMQLSGTSMAAGFVSGAAALLLDARESLSPRDVKTALQMTSSFMPAAGLAGAGAGMINALAAVELARTGEIPKGTTIGGEQAQSSGLFSTAAGPQRHLSTHAGSERSVRAAKWMRSKPTSPSTIVWGARDGDTIIWGTYYAETIVWGSYVSGSTIVWGSAEGDTIKWGSAVVGNTIVWGSFKDGDTIVWGTSADGDTIIWGTAADGDLS